MRLRAPSPGAGSAPSARTATASLPAAAPAASALPRAAVASALPTAAPAASALPRATVASASPEVPAPLAERCTFGVVFPASLQVAAGNRTATIAVAPLPAWTELWVFRQAPRDDGWRIDVLPPAAGQPGDDVGYIETAGFSPDGARVLVAREFRVSGRQGRRFEIIAPDGGVERSASQADLLVSFRRWASPTWRRATLSLR